MSNTAAPHDRLADTIVQLTKRLGPSDPAVVAMLRTAARIVGSSARQAALTDDPAKARAAWCRCAESETAIRVALKEGRRVRCIDGEDYDQVLAVATSAARHRAQAFQAVVGMAA